MAVELKIQSRLTRTRRNPSNRWPQIEVLIGIIRDINLPSNLILSASHFPLHLKNSHKASEFRTGQYQRQKNPVPELSHNFITRSGLGNFTNLIMDLEVMVSTWMNWASLHIYNMPVDVKAPGLGLQKACSVAAIKLRDLTNCWIGFEQ